jgi:hypothetical protein
MTRIAQFFTFGLFLVAIGVIGQFFDWKQANVILALGLLFELLAAMLYIWKKVRPNN